MVDENAAPEWPEDAVRDVAQRMYEWLYAAEGGQWEFVDPHYKKTWWEVNARAALAAIAPHVAVEREAAWIAGRDAAVAWHKGRADEIRFRAQWAKGAMEAMELHDEAAEAIAALTPSSASALDALVAARVAEAVAKWHDGQAAEWNAKLWDRRSWGGPTIGADECIAMERSHKSAADAIRAPAAAKEPGHD